MLKEIIIAFQSYGKAHRFIKKHRLWKWIIVPGLLYMLLFAGSMFLYGSTVKHVIDYLITATGPPNLATTYKYRLDQFYFPVDVWRILADADAVLLFFI